MIYERDVGAEMEVPKSRKTISFAQFISNSLKLTLINSERNPDFDPVLDSEPDLDSLSALVPLQQS